MGDTFNLEKTALAKASEDAMVAAVSDGIGRFEATSLTFTATLLSLAVLEHWFLVLPLPSVASWNWGLRSCVRAPAKGLETKAL